MAKYEKQRRTEPDEDDIKDGITFDKQGRMNYHPEFHPNHGKPFSVSDLVYLSKYFEIDGPRKISFALGRTEHTISSKVSRLRKGGQLEVYQKMDDEQWMAISKGGE